MKLILQKFKLELFLFAIVTLAVTGFFIASVTRQAEKAKPSPTPKPQNIIPKGIINESDFSTLLNTDIGKTTTEELKNASDLKEKATTTTGTSEFVSDSAFTYRENSVVTENSIAVFKRIIPVNPENWKSPQISYYEQLYGAPQKTYKNSVTYGGLIETAVYGDRGIALVYNPFTGEVFEIQSFVPTTPDEYLRKWGSDITGYIQEPGP